MDLENCKLFQQGAESRLYLGSFLGKEAIIKHRFAKKYRHPKLDASIIKGRSKAEARCLISCLNIGIKTPTLYYADESYLIMEFLKTSSRWRDVIDNMIQKKKLDELDELCGRIGETIGELHKNNIIHGDLTTSNVLVDENYEVYLIDFGLGRREGNAEDKGVDLYVLERALLSTHPEHSARLFEVTLQSYTTKVGSSKSSQEVIKKFEEIRLRGRKRSMEG